MLLIKVLILISFSKKNLKLKKKAKTVSFKFKVPMKYPRSTQNISNFFLFENFFGSRTHTQYVPITGTSAF